MCKFCRIFPPAVLTLACDIDPRFTSIAENVIRSFHRNGEGNPSALLHALRRKHIPLCVVGTADEATVKALGDKVYDGTVGVTPEEWDKLRHRVMDMGYDLMNSNLHVAHDIVTCFGTDNIP